MKNLSSISIIMSYDENRLLYAQKIVIFDDWSDSGWMRYDAEQARKEFLKLIRKGGKVTMDVNRFNRNLWQKEVRVRFEG